MHYLLALLSALTLVGAVLLAAVAKSSIHEVLAAVVALISAVLLVGAAVVEAVRRLGGRGPGG